MPFTWEQEAADNKGDTLVDNDLPLSHAVIAMTAATTTLASVILMTVSRWRHKKTANKHLDDRFVDGYMLSASDRQRCP